MLSRRSFLQGLAAAAASLALDPFSCVVTDGRHYRNLRLGLSATLPLGWEFGSIADFASLRERTALLDERDDELHPLKDPDNLPIFLFEAPRLRAGSFAPGIVLYDEPLEGAPPRNELSGHALMLRGFRLSYPDLDVIRPPAAIALRGTPATVSVWSYTHHLEDETIPLLVRSILVFRGDRVHTFHLVDSMKSPCIAAHVWEDFVKSLRYSTPREAYEA